MVILQFFGLPENESQKKKNSLLSGQKIKQKTSIQNLGVLLDEYLLLKPTLNLIEQMVLWLKTLFAFWYPKNSILLSFWYTLRNACQVWGQSNSDILVMVQRA